MEPIMEERHTLSVELASRADEKQLIEAARAGSRDALEHLFESNRGEALRIAVGFTRSAADAEDVVQEAFLKAWRALDRFDPSHRFGPWFRTIVVNEARTHLRAGSRRAAAHARFRGEVERSATIANSADRPVIDAETRRELDRALDGLLPGDRWVIRLRYEMELSEAEMASELGVPAGTVKSRLSRAMSRLREHAVVAIVVLLAAAAVTAYSVPPVRAAIERLLGVTGSEKLIAVPVLPGEVSSRGFDWGRRVNPDRVQGLSPFTGLPEVQGIAPAVRLRTELNRNVLTFDYGADTVSVIPGRGPFVLAKLLPRGTVVRQVRIGQAGGFWIDGAPHALATVDSRGRLDQGPATRMDSGVLAILGPDGTDFRIQTKAGLERAREIARIMFEAAE